MGEASNARFKKRRLSRTGKRRFRVEGFVLHGRQDIGVTLAGVVGNFLELRKALRLLRF